MSKWPSDLMTSARVVDGMLEFTTANSPVVQRRPLPIEVTGPTDANLAAELIFRILHALADEYERRLASHLDSLVPGWTFHTLRDRLTRTRQGERESWFLDGEPIFHLGPAHVDIRGGRVVMDRECWTVVPARKQV